MKKILVLSDTHGGRRGLETLRPLIAENDYVVHLGDGAGDMREITAEYPDKTYVCAGNCDVCSPLPDEGILEVEGVRVFYCHGHQYGVKGHLYGLVEVAKERDCAVVLYGHTHLARVDKIEGITLVNPGTLREPVGKGGSYCYLIIHKKEITPMLVGDVLR